MSGREHYSSQLLILKTAVQSQPHIRSTWWNFKILMPSRYPAAIYSESVGMGPRYHYFRNFPGVWTTILKAINICPKESNTFEQIRWLNVFKSWSWTPPPLINTSGPGSQQSSWLDAWYTVQLHINLTTDLSTLSHKHSLEDALASTAVEPITSKPKRMNIYYLQFGRARNLKMTYLGGSGSGLWSSCSQWLDWGWRVCSNLAHVALGRSPQFLTGCWPEALILCHVDVGFDIRLIE